MTSPMTSWKTFHCTVFIFFCFIFKDLTMKGYFFENTFTSMKWLISMTLPMTYNKYVLWWFCVFFLNIFMNTEWLIYEYIWHYPWRHEKLFSIVRSLFFFALSLIFALFTAKFDQSLISFKRSCLCIITNPHKYFWTHIMRRAYLCLSHVYHRI